MDTILDETSLVPCPVQSVSSRILALAQLIKALDSLGAPRVLRSVQDAADRDLADGFGLRRWCHDSKTDRDAGRLVMLRLSKAPFVDGKDGLFSVVESRRAQAITAHVNHCPALGAGLAALTDGLLIRVQSHSQPTGGSLLVCIESLDEEDVETQGTISVPFFVLASEIQNQQTSLRKRIEDEAENGAALVSRLGELFPSLRLGAKAKEQIEAFTGSEPVFRGLVRQLRILELECSRWASLPQSEFKPSFDFSPESTSTLNQYGSMREFPTPAGFSPVGQWTLHSKFSGSYRLYFSPVRDERGAFVLIGYVGPHLPTTKYPTP